MATPAAKGSQKWLQVAVNRRPQLLLRAIQQSEAIGPRSSISWSSPLENDDFREYRDGVALQRAGIRTFGLRRALDEFWPARGPVWDGLGVTSEGQALFVEAKAHIPEATSTATKASPASKRLIEKSLTEARRFYAPKATASWSGLFYQYANRLAHHYFVTKLNGKASSLIFLYFLNADDMLGPKSEEEWRGAVRLIHAVLGLPADLKRFGVFDAFLDVGLLRDSVFSN